VSLPIPILRSAVGGLSKPDDREEHLSVFAHADQGSGRKDQLVKLYNELRPSLMAYLRGLGLSVEEAEDVIQESFLRLVRHLAARHEDQNPRGWLFRVAHNLAMDLFRAGSRYVKEDEEHRTSAALELIDTTLGPEGLAIKQEEIRRVLAAMGRLTQQQRYAVLLRAEGLRYREIGAILSMNTQRVGELVQRALTCLAGDV
jgi:RNA polymerase sigma-70 factor, ECF subfamily